MARGMMRGYSSRSMLTRGASRGVSSRNLAGLGNAEVDEQAEAERRRVEEEEKKKREMQRRRAGIAVLAVSPSLQQLRAYRIADQRGSNTGGKCLRVGHQHPPRSLAPNPWPQHPWPHRRAPPPTRQALRPLYHTYQAVHLMTPEP